MHEPKWLTKAPDWFRMFYENDFYHLERNQDRLWKLNLIQLAAIIGAAIGIVCTNL